MSGAEAREGGRRVALLLEYDGTAYRGSQYQENGPSIQSELESAINKLTGESVRVAFAGRTDAGVHAHGQVAAAELRSALGIWGLRRGLNHFLPRDIAVLSVRDVSRTFDPRRDATNRLYRYRVENRSAPPALDRTRAWHVPKPLDIAAMARAARILEGRHDFAAFAAPYDGSTTRTLRRCGIDARCSRVRIEFEAEAFLPHQVRRTVGPLVEIGLGRMKEDSLVALLDSAVPSSAGPAAPPHGLYLVSIKYDGLDFGLEQRIGHDE